MKELLHQVFYAESYEQGLKRGQELIARFKGTTLQPWDVQERIWRSLLLTSKGKEAHWRAIRTTNMLERTFGEGGCRTKVTPRFFSPRV